MNKLCTSPLAKHPFVIPSVNLRIYSGEELCYFIYHNPALLEEPFLKEDLILFVRNELMLPASADRLMRFAGNSDKQTQLMAVMREFAYYTEEELRSFQHKLEISGKKLPFLRLKEKADALLEQKRYQAAKKVYEELLTRKHLPGYSKKECAGIWKQMAVCDCGMGFYRQGVDCLRQAYVASPDMDIVKLMWQLSKLGGLDWEEDAFLVPEEEIKVWEKEYSKKMQEVCRQEESGEIAVIKGMDSIRQSEALRKYVSGQLEQYRENMQLAL